MEHRNEYHGNSKHANTSSSGCVGSGRGIGARASIPGVGPPVIREQDQYMPIANVIRIMRRILPAHAKISDDAKETIQECVSEYISFVTGEANDRCQREQRKTVTAEDVLWAMSKLGFDDYVPPLTLFLNRYRAAANNINSINPVLGGPGGGSDNTSDDLAHFKRVGSGPALDPYSAYAPSGPAGAFGGLGMLDPMLGGPVGYYVPAGGLPYPPPPPPPSSSGYDPFSQFK